MANICENTLYAASNYEDNLSYIYNYFNDEYKFEWDLGYYEDDCIELYFFSKWSFPEEEMQKFIKGIPNKDDIYIRCLSVEYGCEYVAFHKWEGDTDNWICK